MAKVKVIVIRAAGINCEVETMHSWRLAGAEPKLVHVRELIDRPAMLGDFQILTLPGGFSYGDDIAAGRILARRIEQHWSDDLRAFVDAGKLVLGICNGFQVLVQIGLLPGGEFGKDRIALSGNTSGRYEDRWVRMKVDCGHCPFLTDLDYAELPVAHGEGRITTRDPATTTALQAGGHVALRYVPSEGLAVGLPFNPNGSVDDIAGLTDATGRVLGLMPHPDRFFDTVQHPLWTRAGADRPPDGLQFFLASVRSLQ